MEKEVKSSYDLEKKAQESVEQGLTVSYFNNTLGAIKSLGITSVRDVSNSKSDMPSTYLLEALIKTKYWLNNLAEAYSKKNKEFTGLETMLSGDPLSQAAVEHQWSGLFPSEDKESIEHSQYIAFSVVWQHEKAAKFRELVEKYWQAEKPQPAQPGFIKKAMYHLGRRAADLAILGIVATPIGYFLYQNYLKPDVKDEIKSSIPYIPTLDEMVSKFKPEIRKELSHYNDQSAENIERVIINVLNKYSEKNPLLKKVLPELADELKKEFNPELGEKQDQPSKKPRNTEEDF